MIQKNDRTLFCRFSELQFLAFCDRFITVLLPFYCRFPYRFIYRFFDCFFDHFLQFFCRLHGPSRRFSSVFTLKPPPRPDRFLTVFFAVFFPDPGPFFGGSPGGSAGPFFCRFPLKKGAPGVSEKKRQKNAPVVFLDH